MWRKFRFLIESNEVIIAAFFHESDRDECVDFLSEQYDDCEFSSVNAE